MEKSKRPNLLVIVADDLGFSDTSPYGSEIDTPNLQRLADEGLIMTGFHTAASCSPTRSMLLSGTDSHIAGLGAMAEQIRMAPEVFQGKPGYEGYLNDRVAALPELLQDNGYWTMMSGKWHLGLRKELGPHARGFSRVLTTLPGMGNHFNHEPQLYGLKEKPKALFWGDGLWMEDGDFIDGAADLPKDFYSSNTFTDYFLDYMKGRSEEDKRKPFFGYLPFTAPHWPLQAPPEVIQKYRGKYDEGPEALRERRLKSLVDNKIVPPDVEAAPLPKMKGRVWDDLADTEKARSVRSMEIFAAMVDIIDVNIGRVLAYLESTGELDNTLVVFMSDNGAEGALLEAAPVLAGHTLTDIIAKYCDNSLENMGAHDSFVWYGPQWAGAATAPSRGLKTWTTEGGIHCPCIVRFPPALKKAGVVNDTFTTCMDVMPTFLELAGISHPAPTFRGRQVAPMRGKSWVPLLARPDDRSLSIYDRSKDVVGWEQVGVAAVRVGDWKAVFIPPPKGPGRWELYDLSTDLGEVRDLAEDRPDKLREMVGHYETYVQETGMFDAHTLVQTYLKRSDSKKYFG